MRFIIIFFVCICMCACAESYTIPLTDSDFIITDSDNKIEYNNDNIVKGLTDNLTDDEYQRWFDYALAEVTKENYFVEIKQAFQIIDHDKKSAVNEVFLRVVYSKIFSKSNLHDMDKLAMKWSKKYPQHETAILIAHDAVYDEISKKLSAQMEAIKSHQRNNRPVIPEGVIVEGGGKRFIMENGKLTEIK